MTQRRFKLTTMFTAVAATAISAAAVLPAAAAPPYSFQLTSNPAYADGTTLDLTGTNAGNVTITNGRSGYKVTCTGATAVGTTKVVNPAKTSSTDTVWQNVAQLTDLKLTGCTSSTGVGYTAGSSATSRNPWPVDVTGATTSSGVTGTRIRNVAASLTSSPSSACSFSLAGSGTGGTGVVSGTFANSSQQLSVTGAPTLTVGSVQGNCAGSTVRVGDPIIIVIVVVIVTRQGTVRGTIVIVAK